jgi:hypothetical protein
MVIVWPAKSSRMGQLATDDHVLVITPVLAVGLPKPANQVLNLLAVGFAENQLVGVGSTIGPYGHGFATPDQFRPRLTKSLPATNHRFGDSTLGCPIPAFHGLNRDPITNPAIFPL